MFWTGVAQRLRARGIDPDLSGRAGPFHRYKHQVSLDRLFPLLPVAGLRVLELGCGPGGNLRVFSGRNPARLVGADIAPGMVALARTNTGHEVVQLDPTEQLPFADAEFDCAFTHAVLQHIPAEALEPVIGELCRVTRSTLLLIEDTAAVRERSYGGSYWVRRDEAYIAPVTACGFRLCDITRSNVWASETTWLAIRRVMSIVELTAGAEGDPVSQFEYGLERAALRVTRHLDRLVPQSSGKSALRFARIG